MYAYTDPAEHTIAADIGCTADTADDLDRDLIVICHRCVIMILWAS